MLRSLKFAVVSFAAFALHPAAAIAQDWPTKPVKILIGFGAGGGTDVATRIVAEGLSEILGQQFTVENRPGAGGTIAGGMAARAPKDGYTAVALSMGHTVSAVMVKNVPYDPVADFAPIGIFTNSAIVVAVGKNSPVTDLKSLVAMVHKEPGKYNYSTVGLGSTQHLIVEDLIQRTGMKAQAVPYKTTGEVMTALIRGDSAFAMDLYHAMRGQIDAGELRVIATATPKRWGADPERSGDCGDHSGLRCAGLVRARFSGGHAAAGDRQAAGRAQGGAVARGGQEEARGRGRGRQPVDAGGVQEDDRVRHQRFQGGCQQGRPAGAVRLAASP